MMGNDPGVRVIRAFGNFSVGHVLYPPGLYRDALIAGGWVEPIERPTSRLAEAARAIAAPIVKRGGR